MHEKYHRELGYYFYTMTVTRIIVYYFFIVASGFIIEYTKSCVINIKQC